MEVSNKKIKYTVTVDGSEDLGFCKRSLIKVCSHIVPGLVQYYDARFINNFQYKIYQAKTRGEYISVDDHLIQQKIKFNTRQNFYIL